MEKSFFLIILITLALCGTLTKQAAAEATVNLEPAAIQIGTFYNGTTVHVSGMIPARTEAVVRVSGEGEEVHLKKKGKVGGLLWMNTGDITLENAPMVYLVFTATKLNDIDHSAARDFGFAALQNRIAIEPGSKENNFLLREFIRFKEHESLYAAKPDSVTYDREENGMKSYQVDMSIPPGMKQGTYTVEVVAVGEGGINAIASTPLNLSQVSLPAQLSNLAFGHSLWYGVMSVFIAVMAGLVMGTLFKGKGGAH